MMTGDTDSQCPCCLAPVVTTQVFVRVADARLHVECFFVLKAEGKLPKPPVVSVRTGS